MLFKNLVAPFARGIAPRPFVGLLVKAGLAVGSMIAQRKAQNADKREWYAHQDDVRKRRTAAARQFNDRIAGLEGIDLGTVAGAAYTGHPPPVTGGQGGTDPFQRMGEAAAGLDDMFGGGGGGGQGVELTPEGQPADYFSGADAAQAAAGGIGTPTGNAAADPFIQAAQQSI